MPEEISPQNSNRPGATPREAPRPTAKKTHWLFYAVGVLLALVVVIVATVAITLWWLQRPIKPVVLSAQEKAVVEAKLQRVGYGEEPNGRTPLREGNSGAAPTPRPPDTTLNPAPDQPYVPGGKVLRLTEREINGLLNANTDLGNSVRLQFAKDAINAYVVVPIPEDFPVGGGKMFRARGRFRVSLGNGGKPYAILEDVTVFGLSLPKAWLGGLKGENLIGEAMGQDNKASVLKGVKSLRVEPGALVLEVED